jgi:hypothetical protein
VSILKSYNDALALRREAREKDKAEHRKKVLQLRNWRIQMQDVKPRSEDRDYSFMRRDEFYNPDN